MAKVSRILLLVLTRSFLISTICLLLAFLLPEESFLHNLFGLVGFGGFFITIWLFGIHLLVALINFIIGRNE